MALNNEVIKSIDSRIRDIVVELNELPFCTTLHSCSGHPHTDSAATPYMDIKYESSKKAVNFHSLLLEKVPYIDFKILPIEYRKYDFREVITKGNYFIHYYMYGKHTEERINEFWNGWRKVLNKYK